MFKVAFAFSMWMFLCLWREVYELNEPMECIISSTVAITGRRILLIMNLFITLRNDPFLPLQTLCNDPFSASGKNATGRTPLH